ncbi:zinc finger matrin-type protein 1-like [Grammomys surdaster]|uniref:zinc finger matrin-type protein 1-like n=1 Tax=Grammomys surdaster TaxID=491861 RepID=UPI00109FB42D|nr:zinc finger matrin-type protein 1-like [Grammomys surdaster]
MEEFQTTDSFRYELEDFIRKQKARGLQPNVCFRKMAEDSIYQKRDCVSPGVPELGLPFWFRNYSRYSPYKSLTVENQIPYYRQRLESLKHCLKNQPVSQDRKERIRLQKEGGATTQEPGIPRGKLFRGSCREDSLSRRKVSAEPRDTEKSKHRKENHHNGRDSTKGRHRSHRKKKEPEERDLWDEAILGSRY